MGLEPTISDVTGRRFNQIKLHFQMFVKCVSDMSEVGIEPTSFRAWACYAKPSTPLWQIKNDKLH